MKIIEIIKQENGSHRNQTGNFNSIPEGWAVIPENLETPNFPFGEITISEIDGIMTVTNWIALEIPEKIEQNIEEQTINTPEKLQLSIEIENLKNELSVDDYKIIKCMEAQLVNEELPYDIALLHQNREILRARINELESKLETLA